MKKLRVENRNTVEACHITSVADPDVTYFLDILDPLGTRYRSGSFYHHAKILKKP
jgi:hypothetical protein